ncbi:MAG: MSCRAMM family protein, partial [Sciscionella sp.]
LTGDPRLPEQGADATDTQAPATAATATTAPGSMPAATALQPQWDVRGLDRVGERLRTRLPDAAPPRNYPVTRSLIQLLELLREISTFLGPTPRRGPRSRHAQPLPCQPAPLVAAAQPATGATQQRPLVSTAVTALPASSRAPSIMLAGIVGTEAGAPLEDAVVLLTDAAGKQVARTRTGTTGGYRVRDVPVGDYVVVATAEGFAPNVTTVLLRAERTARYSFALAPLAVLRGTVRGPASIGVLAGVRVTLLADTGAAVATVTTDHTGHYAVPSPTPGWYTVVASGYPPVATQAAVVPGRDTRLELRLGHDDPPDGGPRPADTVIEPVNDGELGHTRGLLRQPTSAPPA